VRCKDKVEAQRRRWTFYEAINHLSSGRIAQIPDFLRNQMRKMIFPPNRKREMDNRRLFLLKSIGRSREGCQGKTEEVIQKPLDMF